MTKKLRDRVNSEIAFQGEVEDAWWRCFPIASEVEFQHDQNKCGHGTVSLDGVVILQMQWAHPFCMKSDMLYPNTFV